MHLDFAVSLSASPIVFPPCCPIFAYTLRRDHTAFPSRSTPQLLLPCHHSSFSLTRRPQPLTILTTTINAISTTRGPPGRPPGHRWRVVLLLLSHRAGPVLRDWLNWFPRPYNVPLVDTIVVSPGCSNLGKVLGKVVLTIQARICDTCAQIPQPRLDVSPTISILRHLRSSILQAPPVLITIDIRTAHGLGRQLLNCLRLRCVSWRV